MTKPKLLDLFCGAGGAAMGYHRAGFEVVGVDIKPQKHYPFEFHQADAMRYPLDGFDVIHASPPCQAFTALKTMWNAKEYPDLLTPIRERLLATNNFYVIENVPGAPINYPLTLCGTMFGLRTSDGSGELRRHRVFDTNWWIGLLPECSHQGIVIGVYGGHGRDRRRTVKVLSKGGGLQSFPLTQRREAMGIDWMADYELSQAIPPAYTEFIGKQLMEYLK